MGQRGLLLLRSEVIKQRGHMTQGSYTHVSRASFVLTYSFIAASSPQGLRSKSGDDEMTRNLTYNTATCTPDDSSLLLQSQHNLCP